MTDAALALCVIVGSGAHRLGMECASCREIQAALDAYAAEHTAALRALVGEYLEVEKKSMSAVQCEAYGVPFTHEIAEANVRVGECRERLKALLATPSSQP